MLPETGLIIWMTLIFLIVFSLLAGLAFPVISKMVKTRRAHLNESLRLAKETDARAASMHAEYDALIEQAHAEQRKLVAEANEVRRQMIEKAKSEAQEEAQKLLADAKIRIEAETQSAIKDIRRQIAMLSVQVAEKVIVKELASDQAQVDFVNKMLDQMNIADNQTQS